MNEVRVRADQLARRLEQYNPGDRISILVARRERLLRLEVIVGTAPAHAWELDVDPGASDTQRARLAAWLRPPA
jgi:predicted metalloprotease with PDZ domain